MKRITLICVFLVSTFCLSSQVFTWMKGTNTGAQTGLYGTLGLSSATNNPGCRHGAATWVDTQGNLWLFGGEGFATTNTLCWLNDLWKYNVSTNEWTWIGGANTANQMGTYGTQGVPSASNQPGAREFMNTWTDASGNFWMFGGDGFDANNTFGKLGDLWRYNPSTNQWTWMKGFNTVDQNGIYGSIGIAAAGNAPGGRNACGSWMDASGNLWLFGGRGLPATGAIVGFLNDLWKYNISTNQWTWVNGSNLISQNGVFGTLNLSSPSNSPGGNEFPATWYHAGELYMFGGRGYQASGPPSYHNAFWKYNLTNNQWTWIGGNTTTMAPGNYGTQGIAAPGNVPGARMSPASWNDGTGNLWLFAGEGNAASVGLGALNDLFRYNISSGNWTWVKGANVVNQLGTYGTQTLANANNIPGGRYYNSYWPSTNGKCWLIGGLGYSNINLSDNMEDLWKFNPSCNPETVSAAPGSSVCSGNAFTLSASYSGSNTISWYTLPSGGSAIGSGTQLVTPSLQAIAVNSVYTFYTEAAGCTNYPRTLVQLTVAPSPTIVLSANSPICSGDVYNCWTSGTAVSYTWSNGSNSSTLSVSLLTTTGFTVSGSALNGCTSQSTITAIVLPLPAVSIVGSSSLCSGNSAVLSASGSATSYTWSTGSNSSSISVTPLTNSVYQLTGKDGNNCQKTSTHSITVLPLPAVSILSKTVICKGEQMVLTANGAATYSWSTGQTANSISVSPQSNTVYSVVGTSSNSCSNSASQSVFVSACLSLESGDQQTDILLQAYPNPGQGEVTIKCSAVQKAQVTIFNALGQQVFSKEAGLEKFSLQLSEGIYFCVLCSENKILKTLKLVIQ
ncbi:MAG: T9SS type A sorting domain-containing protein [Bacteroidia bacterium]|nr:T9SS type A sorting domain-containing protein [Bacteroidia bacterium]